MFPVSFQHIRIQLVPHDKGPHFDEFDDLGDVVLEHVFIKRRET